MSTIKSLKDYIGSGARVNKYELELFFDGLEPVRLNVLCHNIALPAKAIQTVSSYKRGRKYNMRGETTYGDTFTISFYEDENYSIRRQFDAWMTIVDDSAKFKQLGGVEYDGSLIHKFGKMFAHVNDAVNTIKSFGNTSLVQDVRDGLKLGLQSVGHGMTSATYQTECNVWALGPDQERRYGWCFQNCFVSGLESLTLDDTQNDTIVDTTVTMTFSEFVPLHNNNYFEKNIMGRIWDNGY